MSMALEADGGAYLLCWNGHRFGLDGEELTAVETGAAHSSTPTAISRSGASCEDGAAG